MLVVSAFGNFGLAISYSRMLSIPLRSFQGAFLYNVIVLELYFVQTGKMVLGVNCFSPIIIPWFVFNQPFLISDS